MIEWTYTPPGGNVLETWSNREAGFILRRRNGDYAAWPWNLQVEIFKSLAAAQLYLLIKQGDSSCSN